MKDLPNLRLRSLVVATFVGGLTWIIPNGVVAQDTRNFLPGSDYLPRVYAGPREPTTLAKFVIVSDSLNQFGSGLEGEAGLGASIPVFRLAGTSPANALVIGIQGGVFARFQMETEKKDLIASDWIFAVPIVLHRSESWLRVRYIHLSSHIGDEYSERFRIERLDFGTDGLEGLGYLQILPQVGVYGGGSWFFNVDPNDVEHFALRFGSQLRGPRLGGRTHLYGALDAQMEQDNGWDPRLNVQTGLRLGPLDGKDVRFAVEFLTGPSPQGQFHGQRTTFMTVGVYLDL